jgi:hypothetical protein
MMKSADDDDGEQEKTHTQQTQTIMRVTVCGLWPAVTPRIFAAWTSRTREGISGEGTAATSQQDGDERRLWP